MTTTVASSEAGGLSDAAPPSILSVTPDEIPPFLKGYAKRWAPWQKSWKEKKRKYDKVPCDPWSLRHTSTKGSWWSFDVAHAAYLRGAQTDKAAGVGFNMTGIEGLVGIDLDRCVVDGALVPWGREVVTRMKSYAEFSPSGNGIRIFASGSVPRDWTNHERGIEVYAGHAPRFLTVTGRRIPEASAYIQDLPLEAMAWLEATHKPNRGSGRTASPLDMPELLHESTLPKLVTLNLSAAARDFLEGQPFDDRSHALAVTTRSLYEATATAEGRLRDDIVLSMLIHNPHAWEVALDHRGGDDDAATEYLWKHHCLKVRSKVSPAVLDFDVIEIEEPIDVSALVPSSAPAPAASSIAESTSVPEVSARLRGADINFINLAELAHTRPPERRWTVEQWMAKGTVTTLFGPPGVGKSLIAEQLAVAVANGDPWLGIQTTRGPVIGLFGEDDDIELKWRAIRIFRAGNYEVVPASNGLHLDARAGKPNSLVDVGVDRVVRPTTLLRKLHDQCRKIRPVLVILDNVAQMFTGVENDRGQVTAFCNQLTGLALAYECAVLLLGHPAKAAGSEYSGSTAWEGAVRARLFLDRQNDGTLILAKAKANYSELGKVVIEYQPPGVFARVGDGASPDPAAYEEAKAQILSAVKRYTARQQAVSHVPTARNFLPRVMTRDESLGPSEERLMAKALNSLIDSRQLIPNTVLGWKGSDRHKPKGLAFGTDSPETDLG